MQFPQQTEAIQSPNSLTFIKCPNHQVAICGKDIFHPFPWKGSVTEGDGKSGRRAKEVGGDPATGDEGMQRRTSCPDCHQWFQVGFDWNSNNAGKRDMHLLRCFAKCEEHNHHHHLFLLHFKQALLLSKVPILTCTTLVSISQKSRYLTQRPKPGFWQEWEFRHIPAFRFSSKLNPGQSDWT